MRRKLLRVVVALLIPACLSPVARSAPLQEEKPGKLTTASADRQSRSDYRIEYVVRESEDGKRLNSRTYKVLALLGQSSKIRVGSRVPYVTGSLVTGPPSGTANQVQYQDVGINIDCIVREEGNGEIVLGTNFESLSVSQEGRNMGAGVVTPVFRQVAAEGQSQIPLGKPTVINVVDDVASNRQYEIEVTVTKVK